MGKVRFYTRVRHFAVVWWTAEGETAIAALDVVAGLSQRAVMGPCGALINVYNTGRGHAKGSFPLSLSTRETNPLIASALLAEAFGKRSSHLCKSVHLQTWRIRILDMRTDSSQERSRTCRCTDGRCSESTRRCLGDMEECQSGEKDDVCPKQRFGTQMRNFSTEQRIPNHRKCAHPA